MLNVALSFWCGWCRAIVRVPRATWRGYIMNRNQYVTKQRWFCEQSAKSNRGEYTASRQQCLVDPSSGHNQAQGSVLSASTESQRLIPARKPATCVGNPLANDEDVYD